MNWSLFPALRRRMAQQEPTAMEGWFRDFFEDNGRFPVLFDVRMPRADVAETDQEFLVTLEMPGMEDKDVDVRLNGNTLVVTGERKQKKEDKDKYFHRVETTYGKLERRFELPQGLTRDLDRVAAKLVHGMLEIRVPKAEPKPAARIPVQAR